jgi:threonine dehydratase
MPRVHLERIEAASASIDPVFLDTPQFECEPLGDALGTRMVLKVETLNPIRSFKGRGASLYVQRDASPGPLVCASAGNFGQAMAYACRSGGRALVVFAAHGANALKLARMRALGADVRLAGHDFDDAKLAAKAFARDAGLAMVEDARDVATAEGAGTIALELLRGAGPLDAVLVPLGNGALLAGVATVVKALRPGTRVVGVAAAGAPAMVTSLRTGRLVSHASVATIADGIGVRIPVPEALEDLDGLVDDTVLVEDASLLRALRLVHEHAGVVTEPSGVAGVAAVLERPDAYRGARVATILCGGNLTTEQYRTWLVDPPG